MHRAVRKTRQSRWGKACNPKCFEDPYWDRDAWTAARGICRGPNGRLFLAGSFVYCSHPAMVCGTVPVGGTAARHVCAEARMLLQSASGTYRMPSAFDPPPANERSDAGKRLPRLPSGRGSFPALTGVDAQRNTHKLTTWGLLTPPPAARRVPLRGNGSFAHPQYSNPSCDLRIMRGHDCGWLNADYA